ncbi:MAG TPA: chloride channel protein [bacterium]|nr:chloride channel protein [bacterium]
MKTLLYRSRTVLERFQSHEYVFSLAVAMVVGVLTGLAAVVLRYLIVSIQWASAFLPEWSLTALGVAAVGIVAAPIVGGLVVGPIITFLAPEAKGHGVPEVMSAVILKGGFIRPRVAAVKAVASAITIGSGGSVGREGPIIQIGSSVGATLGYVLHTPPRLMRTYVACGAAGGIAAAFNAPIAGALFAVEVILGDFGFVRLAPIVTSSVMATVVARSILGDLLAFQVPHLSLMHPVELSFYVGVGLACGLAAVAFIYALDYLEDVFDKHMPRVPNWVKPGIGGIGVGLMGLMLPQTFGLGYSTMDGALHSQLAVGLLVLLVFGKLFATSITLASGGSGGIFAPSLFMGSMVGGTVGWVANQFLPELTAPSGAYALVGMGAMVGAATHAPITAIVIIFEMTNDYKIILPLMISVIIAVLTASALCRESIYTEKLRRLGIDYDTGPEVNVLRRSTVRDIMREQFDQVPQDLPFNFLYDQLLQTARAYLPVVDEGGSLLGLVSRDVAHSFGRDRSDLTDVVVARDLADSEYPFLMPSDRLDQAMQRFNESDMRELYVVEDMVDRRVVGMVHKGDLMDVYHREMVKRATGDVFAYTLNRPHGVETVKVMDGYGIIEVESPHNFTGKVLRELDLRNRFGVNVLAVKRRTPGADNGGTRVWVPESSDRLQDGDVLVLMGRTEDIDGLQRRW